jgi:hypothetical protein
MRIYIFIMACLLLLANMSQFDLVLDANKLGGQYNYNSQKFRMEDVIVKNN